MGHHRVMKAMLATAADSAPTGPGWLHEIKWDGMRILADVHDGRLRLTTRTGADATPRFPELAGLARLHPDVLLDGEVVSLERGVPSFSRLVERIHARPSLARRLAAGRPVTYVVFDVLRLDGHDLTRLPLRDRRALLESLEVPGPRAIASPVYPDGEALVRATREQGLEGVVSKRVDSGYEPGRRSDNWRKVAHRPTVTVVVGGWRPESTTGTGLGALLVGLPGPLDGSGWRFVGRVGSGLGPKQGAVVLPRLLELARDACPFEPLPPPVDVVGTRWVEPRLVADVRSLGAAGHTVEDDADPDARARLRQPTFVGLRSDLVPQDLREMRDA